MEGSEESGFSTWVLVAVGVAIFFAGCCSGAFFMSFSTVTGMKFGGEEIQKQAP